MLYVRYYQLHEFVFSQFVDLPKTNRQQQYDIKRKPLRAPSMGEDR